MIIGIASYHQSSLRLQTPVHDANALAELLRARHGYQVLLYRDGEATRARLEELFDFELPRRVDESSRVLVYFAGHGVATETIATPPSGYLVPADGGDDKDSLLSMDRLKRAREALPCKHLLLFLDCCFGGAFRWAMGRDLTAPRGSEMYRERYEWYLETPAWQVITSAAHDERASDLFIAGMGSHRGASDPAVGSHSPFFHALKAGLEGDADVGPSAGQPEGDGVITATDLYRYLRERLEPVVIGMCQTPQLWLFPNKHHKGEYIFHVPDRPLNLGDAVPLSRATSPYRGLEAYELGHAPYFHGRGGATEALVAQVERQPITVVVGSSGAGKSSLVRAGLIPALRARRPGWQILDPIRIAPAPLAALEEAGAQRREGETVLVIEDLEEIFAASTPADERLRFFDGLGALAAQHVRIVGTLRADLEAELVASARGPLGSRWEEIRAPLADPTRDQLRDAIELPAEKMILRFDPPDLVERLIDSVVERPGALQLLSFAMSELYLGCLRRADGGRRLVPIDERDPGGIIRALCDRAEAIYRGLRDDATRDTMQHLLLRMVKVRGGSATPRRVMLRELDFADEAEQRRVEEVLEALAGKPVRAEAGAGPTPPGLRLAVRGGDRHGGFIELAHDAIVDHWPRFEAWWTAAREDLPLRRAVAAAAEAWMQVDRHPATLWVRHPRLASVHARLTAAAAPARQAPPHASPHQLNRIEAEFVTRSHDAEVIQRHKQGLAIMRTVLLIEALVVAMLIVVVIVQSRRAANERAEAISLVAQGARASTLARAPGQEQEALIVAIEALARAMRLGRPPDATILRGAVEAAGNRRLALPPSRSRILSLACSSDGARLARSGADGAVSIYADGKPSPLDNEGSTVLDLAFTPDGSAIVVGDETGHVQRWPLAGGGPRLLVGKHARGIAAVAVSPDGRSVGTGGYDGSVRLWSLEATGSGPAFFGAGLAEVVAEVVAPAHELRAPDRRGPAFADTVTDVAFSPDGQRIAASSRDGTSLVWSTADRSVVLETAPEKLRDRVVAITSVDFSPDGAKLVTGGMRTVVRHLPSGASAVLVRDEHTLFARFSPVGQELITGSRDGTVRRWDAMSLQPIGVAIKNAHALSVMRYCGDAARVAIADEQQRSHVHRLDRDNAVMVFGSRNRPVLAVTFRDGKTIEAKLGKRGILAGVDEQWDLASGSLVPSVSSDGRLPRVETSDEVLLSWDMEQHRRGDPKRQELDAMAKRIFARTKRDPTSSAPGTKIDERRVGLAVGALERRALPSSAPAEDDAVDGDLLTTYADAPGDNLTAVTLLNGAVEIFEIVDGRERRVRLIQGHVGAAWSVAYSPRGDLIATTGDDGTVRLWDAKTGAALAVFTGHKGPVLAVSFSQDGRYIATGGHDGTIRIFPVRPAGILELACNRLGDTVSGWDAEGTEALRRVKAYCPPG